MHCYNAPFYLNRLTLNLIGRSNDMPSEMWDEITYPLQNFVGCIVEVWEWIINFISHFMMDVITYPVEININIL